MILTKKLPEWKEKKVNEIAEKIANAHTVAIVDIKGLPAPQFHRLRGKLRDYMNIQVVKKSILKFAIEKAKNSKKNIEKLNLGEMPAILFSELSPFKLAKLFQENMAPAAAKPGQIAPEDIVIQAGPTPFAPGPMLSELKALGLQVKVEAGKIVVQKDSTIVKKGEPISKEVAELLLKLGIQPMKVGFKLISAWEDGFVFGEDVLAFNVEEYIENLQKAASEAFKLSIGLPYPTKENISILITKAYNEAKALAREREIFTEELAGEFLSKAQAQATELNKYVESKSS